MTNEEKVRHWVELSDYDMETAEVVFNAKRYLYVGFTCQQAIEKILKAYYVKLFDKVPMFTHDLLLLAEKDGLSDLLTEEQKLTLASINRLYIATRYEEYKLSITKMLTDEKCKNLLADTKKIVVWIKEKISLI